VVLADAGAVVCRGAEPDEVLAVLALRRRSSNREKEEEFQSGKPAAGEGSGTPS
jgi:hypothetical protein